MFLCIFPQEEELRKGGDPKYAHLNMDLHVFIEVFGPPCEAYALMAHAMEEVKKFLVPVRKSISCIIWARETGILCLLLRQGFLTRVSA